MPLPHLIQRKYLNRFDELIAVGEDLQKNRKTIPGRRFSSFVNDTVRKEPDKYIVDWSGFTKWKTNCLSLLSQLSQVVSSSHQLQKTIESFGKITNKIDHVQWGISKLKAFKDDFERGFLGDFNIDKQKSDKNSFARKELKKEKNDRDSQPIPSFEFIKKEKIKEIIKNDYIEIEKCMNAKCFKAAIILSGGCIEGILYDLLKSREGQAKKSSKADKTKHSKVKCLEQWDLAPLIETAFDLKLIQENVHKLSHTVREFRNLVHTGRQLRSKLRAKPEEANIAFDFLKMLIRDLQEKTNKKKMLTLKGKFVKTKNHPEVYIIDGTQKRQIAAPNHIPQDLRDKYENCSQELLDMFDNGAKIHSENIVIEIRQKAQGKKKSKCSSKSLTSKREKEK